MRIIAFIENYNDIDRIIRHPKLTFAAERPAGFEPTTFLFVVRSSI